jgi:ribonuclease E
VELSRQRLKPSFLERNSAACKYCNGKGVVRSSHSNSILILRTIEKELASGNTNVLNIFAHIDTVLYVLNKKRKDIERIEQDFAVEINFYEDKAATAESFYIEKIKIQVSKKKEVVESRSEPKVVNKVSEAVAPKNEKRSDASSADSSKKIDASSAKSTKKVAINKSVAAAKLQEVVRPVEESVKQVESTKPIQKAETIEITTFTDEKSADARIQINAKEDDVKEGSVDETSEKPLAARKKRRIFQRRRKFANKKAKEESTSSDQ